MAMLIVNLRYQEMSDSDSLLSFRLKNGGPPEYDVPIPENLIAPLPYFVPHPVWRASAVAPELWQVEFDYWHPILMRIDPSRGITAEWYAWQ